MQHSKQQRHEKRVAQWKWKRHQEEIESIDTQNRHRRMYAILMVVLGALTITSGVLAWLNISV